MNKDIVLKSLRVLIEKYEQVKKSNQIKKYSEEETKKDFILPLFEIFGWNVSDRNEVSAEEHIASLGRVDYGFYINGRVKFYMEAKGLKEDLHREEYAKQAIRYAFNKGVTWAVLTNFESIKVFNAQAISKYLGDKLYFEISYDKYIDRLGQLLQLSKNSFEKDLIDIEAKKVGKMLQKIPVGELLYKDLKECREILTKDLSSWNENVDKELLDEGVQKILDRLIFLRVAEDRKIEPPTLIPLIRRWESTDKKIPLYKSMIATFRELDSIYDSNLFSKHPFEEWEDYSDATKKVINILYGKEGYYEYDFKAMPADILGGVYENYLGYKLSQSQKGLSIGKNAKKRKEQGIYYTPTFIADYIVRNALKPVLDKCKNVNDLMKIKVLDPACGSGSFLIKALDVINEKYKEFGYEGNEFTKIQIILQNLYGVDLDEQAVEIARLNLLINTLEQRGIMPSLDGNIKNGNSLISGTDKELEKYFGKNFKDKKPFNWEEEFPEVFKQGGFDVIIGNPPYVNFANINDSSEREYLRTTYSTAKNKSDLYSFFTERAISLIKERGYLGFIFSNSWLSIDSFSKFRQFLIDKTTIKELVKLPPDVFRGATVTTILIFLKKMQSSHDHEIILKEYSKGNFIDKGNLSYLRIKNTPGYIFSFQTDGKAFNAPVIQLGKITNLSVGIKTADDKRFIFERKTNKEYYPFLLGRNVARYSVCAPKNFIWYKPELMRQKVGAVPLNLEIFNKPRILVKDIGKSIQATLDVNKNLCKNTLSMIYNIKKPYDIFYILALLNSRLLSDWFLNNFQSGLHLQLNQLKQIPIHEINFSKGEEKKCHDNLVGLAKKMIDLNKELTKCEKNSNKWNSIKGEIEKTDKKIDEEVYGLYGLTPEEIVIVEGKN